jgi:hypothetical protein
MSSYLVSTLSMKDFAAKRFERNNSLHRYGNVRITDNIMYHRCESGGERVTLISILVFIVPDSTMMFVHLSVNVMLMDGYKHH